MNEKSLRVLEFNKIKDQLKAFAQTEAGREIIDSLKPYESIFEGREHLQETKEALDLLNRKGNPPFEGIYDVREAIGRAEKGGALMANQLLRLAQLLSCARRFKDYLRHKEEEEGWRVIEDICEGLTPLKALEDAIFTAIIGENEISDRASTTLNNIRRSLKEKNSSIKDKINSLMRSNAKYLQENLYTIRGDRYVIPVKAEHKSSVPGLVHDQSSTGATLFIEPMSLVNLNNEIKELMLKEKAEIERILAELSQRVYENIGPVKIDAAIIWELDFIFAKGKYGGSLNGACPIINNSGIIDIIEGRHPLIDPKNVVPISVYIGREFTSLVVTGPNTGGKTVTLKTTGLLNLMGMSGLLIPARDNSSIGFFKEVYADIGDEQSIEQSLSTFSSHMTNIVNIIEKADEHSLVLFDELGAGTDPTEGAALAVAILEELRGRKSRVMATTHYSELKGYGLKTPNVENASVEFDIETLRPTYRLLIGIPGKSNAFEISRRLGLPDYVIKNAKESISSESLHFEDLIQNLQEKSIKAETDARLAEILKLEAVKLKEKLQEKIYNFDKSKENVTNEAQRNAKLILREAKEEADSIIKNMRELEKQGIDPDIRQKLEEHRRKLKDKMDTAEEASLKRIVREGEGLKTVKEGQEVFIPSLNQKAFVISKVDNKGEVQVQAGIMKISVKLKDLRLNGNGNTEVKKSVKRELKLNMKATTSSVDLRGLDSEEASYTTEKYLDEAFLSGLGEVTIIHGKGTGVLRQTINDLLRSHPNVKNFRLGEYGEGGNGVTVVEFI